MPVEDPHPDWIDVMGDPNFHGVAWIPTVLLRFVEREEHEYIDPHHAQVKSVRILQQMWETSVVNNSGTMQHVINPGKRGWRDVELRDEAEDLPVSD